MVDLEKLTIFIDIKVQANKMSNRKNDHITLATKSRITTLESDNRFYYEPLLASHPLKNPSPFNCLGKTLKYPIWVSSMTGGADQARNINHNLATICREFGFGMGLGSCRILLENRERWVDFDLRATLGNEVPFYANLGIAQLEELVHYKRTNEIETLVQDLKCDGIIIHINPLQEAIQPGGDKIKVAPLETIKTFISNTNLKVIVKEVGQGFGPKSLFELLKLPLEALEFGALGGTNFALLEMHRRTDAGLDQYLPLAKCGHSASEMVQFANKIVIDHPNDIKCHQLIISGGITNAVDGFYLTNQSTIPAVFGMGSAFLQYAAVGIDELRSYCENLVWSYQLAQNYLAFK